MPSRAVDFAGKPHPTVAWIERGLTKGFRTTIFSDGTYRDGVRVAELEAMGVDPDTNVNDFDLDERRRTLRHCSGHDRLTVDRRAGMPGYS